MADELVPRAPFPTDPEEFEGDARIFYDSVGRTHLLEDERGEEWEFNSRVSKWVPVVCPACR
jgi:HIV Tat-specific factor 1